MFFKKKIINIYFIKFKKNIIILILSYIKIMLFYFKKMIIF